MNRARKLLYSIPIAFAALAFFVVLAVLVTSAAFFVGVQQPVVLVASFALAFAAVVLVATATAPPSYDVGWFRYASQMFVGLTLVLSTQRWFVRLVHHSTRAVQHDSTLTAMSRQLTTFLIIIARVPARFHRSVHGSRYYNMQRARSVGASPPLVSALRQWVVTLTNAVAGYATDVGFRTPRKHFAGSSQALGVT